MKNKEVIENSYELNIIKELIKVYPETTWLVGDVDFTPESFKTLKNDDETDRL